MDDGEWSNDTDRNNYIRYSEVTLFSNLRISIKRSYEIPAFKCGLCGTLIIIILPIFTAIFHSIEAALIQIIIVLF